jgi:hypothetical protein
MLHLIYQTKIKSRGTKRNTKTLRYDMIHNQLNSNLFQYLISNFISIYMNFQYITTGSFSLFTVVDSSKFSTVTKPGQFCWVWSSHTGDRTQSGRSSPTIRRNILPLSSGRALIALCSLLVAFFDPEAGGSTFLRKGRWAATGLCSVMSCQKTIGLLFILIPVRTSNSTYCDIFAQSKNFETSRDGRCYRTVGNRHVVAATVTHATIEELLEAVFSVGSLWGYTTRSNSSFQAVDLWVSSEIVSGSADRQSEKGGPGPWRGGHEQRVLSRRLVSAGLELWRHEEEPLLGDCNQATSSGGCNKLGRVVWVIVICAAL